MRYIVSVGTRLRSLAISIFDKPIVTPHKYLPFLVSNDFPGDLQQT